MSYSKYTKTSPWGSYTRRKARQGRRGLYGTNRRANTTTVKRIIRRQKESKYFDTEVSAFAVGENSAWGSTNDVIKGVMCVPQEGTASNQREGREIEIYKIAIRGVVYATALSGQAVMIANCKVRCLLWMDMETPPSGGTVANSGDIMEAPTNATVPAAFCSFQKVANFGRFRMLKDFALSDPTVTASQDAAATATLKPNDLSFKCQYRFKKPMRVKFRASTGNFSDSFTSIFFTMQKSGGGFAHEATVRARVYYKDL